MIHLLFYLACGMEPMFPPFNCHDAKAQCICDSNGQCDWVWICEE